MSFKSFKNFLLVEKIDAEYAQRYLTFKEQYHLTVIDDLITGLNKIWVNDITNINKKIDHTSDQEFDNMLSVSDKPEKIISSRYKIPAEALISVKVPITLNQTKRDLIIKDLLASSVKVLNNIAFQWKEIFNIEKDGRIVPWFKIYQDVDDIKFQLILGDDNISSYKTLYSVKVEYGNKKSKTKLFDRIYLISNI